MGFKGPLASRLIRRLMHQFHGQITQEIQHRAGAEAPPKVMETRQERRHPTGLQQRQHFALEKDMELEGQLLILQNADQPGVVGRVGTFLGEHRVNIAQLYLSRNKAGGTALSAYQVDSALDAATLAELAKSDHVISVKQISL